MIHVQKVMYRFSAAIGAASAIYIPWSGKRSGLGLGLSLSFKLSASQVIESKMLRPRCSEGASL